MKKRAAWIALLAYLAVSAGGCLPFPEVDETAYVISLTVDKSTINKVNVGVRIPVPRFVGKVQGQAIGVSGGPGQELYLKTNVDAPTILDGINMIQLYTARQLSLEHARALLIGEEIARAGIEDQVAPLIRYPQTRSNMYLSVVRGNAVRLVDASRPLLEANIARFIDLQARSVDLTGLSDAISVNEFYNRLKSGGSDAVAGILAINEKVLEERIAQEREQAGGEVAPNTKALQDKKQKLEEYYGSAAAEKEAEAPVRTIGSYEVGHLPREGGNVAEWVGLAVFRGDRMVGELNGNESIAYRMLSGRLVRAVVTVASANDSTHLITAEIFQARRPGIRIEEKGNQVHITINLYVEANLLMLTSSPTKKENAELAQIVEKSLAQSLEVWVESALHKTQSWGSDIFGFGENYRRRFLTWQEWDKFDWPAAFKKAQVDVTIKIRLRRPGMIIQYLK